MEHKQCKICNQILNIDDFGTDNQNKDKKSRYCKKCSREKVLKYYYDHHDKYKEKNLASYKKYAQKNSEKMAEKNRKYREAHREELSQRNNIYIKNNREKANQSMLKYLKTEKGKEYQKRRNEKYRKLAGDNKITDEQLQECFNFFNGLCAYSGKPLEKGINKTFDHLVSLSKRGTNCIWNIVPCDKSVNSCKGYRSYRLWYPEQSYFEEEKMQLINEWIEYSKNKYMNVNASV